MDDRHGHGVIEVFWCIDLQYLWNGTYMLRDRQRTVVGCCQASQTVSQSTSLERHYKWSPTMDGTENPMCRL